MLTRSCTSPDKAGVAESNAWRRRSGSGGCCVEPRNWELARSRLTLKYRLLQLECCAVLRQSVATSGLCLVPRPLLLHETREEARQGCVQVGVACVDVGPQVCSDRLRDWSVSALTAARRRLVKERMSRKGKSEPARNFALFRSGTLWLECEMSPISTRCHANHNQGHR
jgi:hypothetical protein